MKRIQRMASLNTMWCNVGGEKMHVGDIIGTPHFPFQLLIPL